MRALRLSRYRYVISFSFLFCYRISTTQYSHTPSPFPLFLTLFQRAQLSVADAKAVVELELTRDDLAAVEALVKEAAAGFGGAADGSFEAHPGAACRTCASRRLCPDRR